MADRHPSAHHAWPSTKVAGVFGQQAQAEAAMEALRNEAGLNSSQVRLLRPQDALTSQSEWFGRATDQEPVGVVRTLINTHLVGGLMGALIGLGLFIWLDRASNPLVTNSPSVAFVAVVGFGVTFGLMAAGVVSLRPDHLLLTSKVRAALKAHRWVVVAHPQTREQTAHVKRLLEAGLAEVCSTV